MPPRIARKIYDLDETGMGYVTFELVMRDGKRIPCRYSNVAEFVRLPEPYQPDDISDISSPHRPVGEKDLHGPSFVWCVYATPPSVVQRIAPRLTNVPLDPETFLRLRPESA